MCPVTIVCIYICVCAYYICLLAAQSAVSISYFVVQSSIPTSDLANPILSGTSAIVHILWLCIQSSFYGSVEYSDTLDQPALYLSLPLSVSLNVVRLSEPAIHCNTCYNTPIPLTVHPDATPRYTRLKHEPQ